MPQGLLWVRWRKGGSAVRGLVRAAMHVKEERRDPAGARCIWRGEREPRGNAARCIAAFRSGREVDLQVVERAASDAKSNRAAGKPPVSWSGSAAVLAGVLTIVSSPLAAQQQQPAAQAGKASTQPAASIAVELNKLEPQDKSCRAFIVIDNQSEKAFDVLKLDLVIFQTDGLVGRRYAIDLAPLRAKKRTVKQFDLDAVKCEAIGSFLVNDLLECKSGGAEDAGCLDRLALSSRSNVQLAK